MKINRELVQSISPEEIQQTVRQFCNEDNFIRIVMMPEESEKN